MWMCCNIIVIPTKKSTFKYSINYRRRQCPNLRKLRRHRSIHVSKTLNECKLGSLARKSTDLGKKSCPSFLNHKAPLYWTHSDHLICNHGPLNRSQSKHRPGISKSVATQWHSDHFFLAHGLTPLAPPLAIALDGFY